MKGLSDTFPDMFFRVKKMFLGSSDSSEMEVQVIGPDADVIYNKAQQVVDALHDIPNTIDIRPIDQHWPKMIHPVQYMQSVEK